MGDMKVYPLETRGRVGFASMDRIFFDWLGHELELLPNGHVDCQDCHTVWCDHIQDAVQAGADARPMWEEVVDKRREIAMLPRWNLWITADLEAVTVGMSKGPNAYLVTFDYPGQRGTHLGYLNPGEGMAVIRSMIFDWFQGQPFYTVQRCRSASHKYRQEMAWQKGLKDPHMALTQRWAVWASGSCIYCLGDATDFDDLIPDASRAGRPVFRS